MEDNYLDNGELTFRKIGHKLKLAGLRIVVYVLIAALLVGLVLGIVSAVKTNNYISGRVMFSNDALTSNMKPWDTSLNITQDIKSAALINLALDQVGIDPEMRDSLTQSIRKNLVVTANFDSSNEDKDEEVKKEIKNFSFSIQLENYETLGLSQQKCQEILDTILNQYVENYKSKFAFAPLVGSFKAANEAFNYVYAAEVLDTELAKAINYAEELAFLAPNYRTLESKQSFNAIAEEYKALKNQLNAIRSYLSDTGVMKNPDDPNNELAYIQLNLMKVTSKQTSLKTQKELLDTKSKELADSMKNTVTSGGSAGSVIVNIDQKPYIELVNKLIETQNLLNQVDEEFNYLQTIESGYIPGEGKKSKFELADETGKLKMQKTLNEFINTIVQKGEKLTTELNSTVLEFNTQSNLQDAIKVTQSAKIYSIKALSPTIIIAVEAIVIIIAFIVAMVVTDKCGKKMSFKKKAAKETADANKESDK